jgi:hypothetical protein
LLFIFKMKAGISTYPLQISSDSNDTSWSHSFKHRKHDCVLQY